MWMLTVLLQKQPKYPSATELVKDYTSQWTIWLTEQQSAAITCNTADKTHRTVRKSSQVQRPHTEFIYIEYKTVQCIYGTYSLDNGNLWWGSSQRGVRGSPGVQGSPHPTLWSRCRWHRCTLGDLRDFLWLHLLWYCSHKNHWIHEEARRVPPPIPFSYLSQRLVTAHLLLLLQPLKNKVNKCRLSRKGYCFTLWSRDLASPCTVSSHCPLSFSLVLLTPQAQVPVLSEWAGGRRKRRDSNNANILCVAIDMGDLQTPR